MKLYFAFSNTVVFNQTNIQSNLSVESGDLLVWSTPPIDYHLIEGIRQMSCFDNVWFLERPKIANMGKRGMFREHKLKQNFYNQYLKELIGDKFYDEFIVSGFWNDTMYIVSYLRRNNPNIIIGISEEGLLNYYAGNNHENLYYMLQYNRKQHWKAWVLGGKDFRYIQKHIKTDYLVAPAFLKEELKNNVCKVPSLKEGKKEMQDLVDDMIETLPQGLKREYEQRSIYYIASPWNKCYDPVDMTKDIMQILEQIVPWEHLLIKSHTNSTNHRERFARNFSHEIFVDRQVYLFELLCSKLDLSNKVFVIRNSSCALYLTQLFGVEPTFVFTHRIWSRYHYGADDCGDYYVEDLKKNMKHPERVLVPNSLLEFKMIIVGLCQQYCGGVNMGEQEFDKGESSITEVLAELGQHLTDLSKIDRLK